MFRNLHRHIIGGIAATLLSASFGCSSGDQSASQPLVTDVDHTIVKRQSIGNCWLYAQATWLESILLTHTGGDVDVSESYWTWWHWYEQIVNSNIDELQTGGFWNTSANIILRYGWVTEGEFIGDEDGVEMSRRQAQAMATINEALQSGGSLATRRSRTAANVRRELDKAFGTNMRQTQQLARTAAATVVGTRANGAPVTLRDALAGDASVRWNYVGFPRVYGKDTQVSQAQQNARKQILTRVLKAVNDSHPVVMSLMIDFNALDIEDQTFKKSEVDANGIGTQGGHMVVLEDYTVENAPGYGYIGEGEVSDEMKAAALQGDLLTIKVKNSWGKNRPDRGLTDGYTRFDRDYLFSQLEWKRGDDDDAPTSFYTTLTDFILPPGY